MSVLRRQTTELVWQLQLQLVLCLLRLGCPERPCDKCGALESKQMVVVQNRTR